MQMYFTDDENIKDAFYIRKEVFIKEQGVPPEVEIDGSDKNAKNMILTVDSKPVGTGRLIKIDNKMYLGRLCVLKKYRGKGYAKNIALFLLNEAKNMGYNEVFIHAQSYVKDFYEKIGFKAFGNEFLEAGIPHINMKITLKNIV